VIGKESIDDRLFTANDAWSGGFYELALEVGPRSDYQLRSAQTALWSHPDLDGCFLDRDREPDQQLRVTPDCLEEGPHLLGVAHLPNGTRVACGSCLIREMGEGPDWLAFYLPVTSLGISYPVGPFPFGTEADWPGAWRFEVEDWLASIGQWVARSASYRLGLIGFEVSGEAYAADIAVKGVPAKRVVGYLWPSDESVVYHRRTVG
jgi:hypothetical protein